jgi:hypothetical protein
LYQIERSIYLGTFGQARDPEKIRLRYPAAKRVIYTN